MTDAVSVSKLGYADVFRVTVPAILLNGGCFWSRSKPPLLPMLIADYIIGAFARVQALSIPVVVMR